MINHNLLQRLNDLTPTLFAQAIEQIVTQTGLDYIQAILYYCEKNHLDTEVVPELLNSTLKTKILMNAEDLHHYPKSSKLPI